VNRKLSSLRAFFRWLKKEGEISENPIRRITAPKINKRLPSFAKESDLHVQQLDDYFSKDFDGCRDRLMVEFFYQTGIRLSELIQLKEDDVRVEHLKVLGKRNKERIIPISQDLYELILEYRRLRSFIGSNCAYFFIDTKGNQVYSKFVYRRINTYLRDVTNLDKCSPHVLRHTFATHMLNNGAGLETLKDLLGHANLSATQIYTHNSFAKLTNIYSHAHPRGHKNK
jgi:integrase/recombinase XerC